jgi:hypothetical protein
MKRNKWTWLGALPVLCAAPIPGGLWAQEGMDQRMIAPGKIIPIHRDATRDSSPLALLAKVPVLREPDDFVFNAPALV